MWWGLTSFEGFRPEKTSLSDLSLLISSGRYFTILEKRNRTQSQALLIVYDLQASSLKCLDYLHTTLKKFCWPGYSFEFQKLNQSRKPIMCSIRCNLPQLQYNFRIPDKASYFSHFFLECHHLIHCFLSLARGLHSGIFPHEFVEIFQNGLPPLPHSFHIYPSIPWHQGRAQGTVYYRSIQTDDTHLAK